MSPGSHSYRVRQTLNPFNRFESTQVEWEDGVALIFPFDSASILIGDARMHVHTVMRDPVMNI